MTAALLVFTLLLIVLDISGLFTVTNKFAAVFFLTLAPHSIIIFYLLNLFFPNIFTVYLIICISLLFLYIFIKINIKPYPRKKSSFFRLSVLIGGRRLTMYSFFSHIVHIAFYITALLCSFFNSVNNTTVIISDTILCLVFLYIITFNGSLRILLSSKWLSVIKRVIVLLNLPIPCLNIPFFIYMCHTAEKEFEYENYKRETALPPSSNICKTKYPIVLVHGVGFRDFRFFNYWGRIPKALSSYGASIYYGNQEAWATIETNAADIKEKINSVISETGEEKVNIIAHSKGGLDSRYMISALDMSSRVASLTTISTPHHGCKYADILFKITPDSLYRFLAKGYNRYFTRLGDKHPDFYHVCHQFTASSAKLFNEEIKDSEAVYYQSYASVMKNPVSDYILALSYIFIYIIEGKNDGLVALSSAKWGEFREAFKNKYRRGISHGDMIDLKREDYRGFDVVSKYVEIVADLKNKGF